MVQPFHEVVRILTGTHSVIPIADANIGLNALNAILRRIAERAADAMKQSPIIRSRPNEVGNDVEVYIKDALEIEPGVSIMPMPSSAGYPDIKIYLHDTDEVVFLECKTFGTGKESSSMRSFYLSPGTAIRAKVDCSTVHILMSFEMKVQGNTYTPLSYKLVDLYDLPCNLKEEWQASNKQLYADQRVLVSEIC